MGPRAPSPRRGLMPRLRQSCSPTPRRAQLAIGRCSCGRRGVLPRRPVLDIRHTRPARRRGGDTAMGRRGDVPDGYSPCHARARRPGATWRCAGRLFAVAPECQVCWSRSSFGKLLSGELWASGSGRFRVTCSPLPRAGCAAAPPEDSPTTRRAGRVRTLRRRSAPWQRYNLRRGTRFPGRNQTYPSDGASVRRRTSTSATVGRQTQARGLPGDRAAARSRYAHLQTPERGHTSSFSAQQGDGGRRGAR